MELKRANKTLSLAFNTLLVCLAAGIIVQNLTLRKQVSAFQAVRPDSITIPLQIPLGRSLEMVSGIDLDGNVKRVSALSDLNGRLLIIVMSPDCAACVKNQLGWSTITKDLLQKGNARVVWISRDSVRSTKKYAEEQGIPTSAVLADPLASTYLQLAMSAVPHTVVVGANGKVEKVWEGPMQPEGWTQLRTYLAIPTAEATTSVR